MTTYSIFDAHCDTLYELFKHPEKGTLSENQLHFSIKDARNYPEYIQVFALWADPDENHRANAYMKELVEYALAGLKENKVPIITTYEDLSRCSGLRAILGIEGGDGITTMEDLLYFYHKGVRCLTLTWNGGNAIGEGSVSGKNTGLTPFGKTLIPEMNQLGIAVDVSHLNEAGFWEVLSLAKKPVLATHSNAKTLCPHPRNLSDEQFSALIQNKGVAGINLYPLFLTSAGDGNIEDIIGHIEHFMALGGEDHVGLGCDFDGVSSLPEGIQSNVELVRLFDRLSQLNYSTTQLEKLSFQNFYRGFSEILNVNF